MVQARRRILLAALVASGAASLLACDAGEARARACRLVDDGSDEPLGVAWLPSTVAYWQSSLERAAQLHGVHPDLLAIVVLVESGGNPRACSMSGALGLTQIVPPTARHIASQRSLPAHSDDRLFEPRYNLDLGAWYLAEQLRRFAVADPDRSVDRAAAAYNGGPTRLARHLAGAADLSAETNRYIDWVGGMWRERRRERSATYVRWWQAGGARLVVEAAAELRLPAPDAPA